MRARPEAVKTTVLVPKPLWRAAKRRALATGRSLNDVVLAALRAHLAPRRQAR